MLSSWNRGESVVFERFDDYWGEPATAETVVMRWSSEGAARLLELQAGQVDGIDNPSPDDYPAIDEDPDLQLLSRPALNILYFAMTNTFEPWGDVRVRQAIALGVDPPAYRRQLLPTWVRSCFPLHTLQHPECLPG